MTPLPDRIKKKAAKYMAEHIDDKETSTVPYTAGIRQWLETVYFIQPTAYDTRALKSYVSYWIQAELASRSKKKSQPLG